MPADIATAAADPAADRPAPRAPGRRGPRPRGVAGPAAVAPAGPVAPLPWRPVLLVAAAAAGAHLAVLTRYGWHRDELYYLSAGLRPALGYADIAPVTPWLAGLSHAAFGPSLVGLRLWPALIAAVLVVVGAGVARELGGGRRAQGLAAVAVAASPALLGPGTMFMTVVVDQLAWALVLLAAARVLRLGPGPRGGRWLLLGAAGGLALATKYTAVVLLAGLAVGFVATAAGRARLRERPAALAAAAALAVAAVAPSLGWQAAHGWPFLTFIDREVAEETALGATLLQQLALLGPAGLVLAVVAGRAARRRPAWRPLGLAAAAVVLAFWALGGRSYYPAPLVVLVLPAAAVAVEAWTARRAGRTGRLAVALVAPVALLSPTILPVLPAATMADLGVWHAREDYAEQLGWPALVAQVASAWASVPAAERASATILAGNYGVAGAVEHLGAPLGLPTPASAHLTWRWWTDRADLDATTLVTVGLPRAWLDAACAEVEVAAVVDAPHGVENEEDGGVVAVCRRDAPLRAAWPELLDRGW